jgi:hypothetical protein
LLLWVLKLQRSGSSEWHFCRRGSEAALDWFSFPKEHLKIREKHAPLKILLQRVNQHEAPFLKNSQKQLSGCSWEKTKAKALFLIFFMKTN